MKIDRMAKTTSLSTRLVAMCLPPKAGGGFEVRDVPRRSPAADESEIAGDAASVNPIDVAARTAMAGACSRLWELRDFRWRSAMTLRALSSRSGRVAKKLSRLEIASMESSPFLGTARMPPILS